VEFHHIPVLLQETMEALDVKPGGRYVDCTLGGAGHSTEILKRSAPDGLLIGLDQDDNALKAAGERLAPYGERARLVKTNFAHIADVVERLGVGPVDGVMMDIGVSSHQFDEGERGFSYHQDAPLDMRMDRSNPVSAATVVNEWDEGEIARILWEYSDEKWSRRIAQFIVSARRQKPVETTGELVEIIKAAIPAAARREGGHPARRTFQAIRIAVNDELGALERGLEGALRVLKPGGRLAVITFHSLEDRIVKQTFHRWVKPCTCPPHLPVCVCGKRPLAAHVTRKPVKASAGELAVNPRSRSATLRAIEKLETE
jgi:16S rRNA (cytosine1402-N4)-methyltransferase